VLLALLAAASPARGGSWTTAAPLAEPRQEVAVAELGGRVYVIGGFRANGSIADTVEVYDPERDAWDRAAPLPVPLHHAAAASLDGSVYLVGGWSDFFRTPLASVYGYDPAADEWTPRAPMPTARAGLAVAVWDGLLYAAGGAPPARERDFAAYDPVADAWTPLPGMPTPRNHLGAGAIAGLIYAAGGRVGSILPQTNTAAFEAFDVAAGTWSARAPLPTARSGVAAAALDGRLLVLGGEGNDASPLGVFEEVEAYDPERDAWATLAPMPTPRHGIGAARVGDRVHVPGGGAVEGFGVSAVHEVFVPEPQGVLGPLAALAALAGASRSRRSRG
jgi:N-acetylneuraminic acid mutarotase